LTVGRSREGLLDDEAQRAAIDFAGLSRMSDGLSTQNSQERIAASLKGIAMWLGDQPCVETFP
jgi:hypothetical protein